MCKCKPEVRQPWCRNCLPITSNGLINHLDIKPLEYIRDESIPYSGDWVDQSQPQKLKEKTMKKLIITNNLRELNEQCRAFKDDIDARCFCVLKFDEETIYNKLQNYNKDSEIFLVEPSDELLEYVIEYYRKAYEFPTQEPRNVIVHLPLTPLIIKHPILKFFKYDHLPERLQEVSKQFSDIAYDMDKRDLDADEKTAGLRKLLEAKDCFVRGGV